MEKFVIAKDSMKKVRRFNLTGRMVEFKLKPVPVGEEPMSWVSDAVNQVIQRGTEGLSSNDQVGFSFCSKDFARGDGWVRFRPAEEISYNDVWNVISGVYQSNSTETFCLAVMTVRMPTGRGRGRIYNTFEEECGMRRGIILINNKDNKCLPRALVVAMAYVNKDPEQTKMRRDIGKLQTQRALQLCVDAGVVIPEEGCGIQELQQFQLHLSDYKIVVYSYGSKGRDAIFTSASESSRRLNLLYHKGHYNIITSLTSAFCCSYYCEDCHVPYNDKGKHRCGGTCLGCQQSPACPQDTKVKCVDCKRSFSGQGCYDNHTKTVCSLIRLCEQCLKVVQSVRQHTCGEIFCKVCNIHVPADHLCHMHPDTGKPKTCDFIYIFYDLETRQERVMEDGSTLHEPNLCVFKQACSDCLNSFKEICIRCGVRLQVLKAEDVISPFVNHLLTLRKKFKNVVVIAHNGQAFDHQFVLNYILTKTDLTPELIMRGTKIISMTVGNVKFLDSLNYFPMALSKLPKAFGLAELGKGHFPHMFNTSANQSYIGPLPPLEYYDPDSKGESERDALMKWHAERVTDVFDFQKEIVEYCIADVEILTQACLKFRDQMLNTANVCPFTEACTIASACNKVFRRNFLKPNTIGIIPKNGYRWRDNQSKIATQWLVWEERQKGINIIYTAKQQEARVQGVKVDGYCAETHRVFEFHGCYFHGCSICFKYNRDNFLHNDPCQTLNYRYESTIAKTERLRSLGYEVIEMWECEFKKLLKDNGIREYTENHPLVTLTHLNPRDAFYGDRTGNTFEYYKCKDGEKIRYVDVCSLYPWVCKYGKFPIGHPQVLLDKDCNKLDLGKTEGIIKCKILPPGELYHPVLPQKINNKLMFVLCRTCGEEMNKHECEHSEEQRCLTGTWIIDEVLKALEKGYKITEIYEIWSYQVDQFDKENNLGGLFQGMMDKFIKIKQQASGWPGDCISEEQKKVFIENFLKNEGIQLEYVEISNNPGLRSLAKLMLNSFWGKLGQRENQPKTAIVRKPDELFDMLSNPGIYVNALLPINENTLVVNYEHRDEACEPLSTVNVAIAAYVTAQARLKLYSYLEQLGDRVIYYDTDSIIYISRKGEYDVTTGTFVGDMTDELECYGPNSYISEFVSGGPKNYAYKVFSPTTNEERIVCKVKGISLNYAASQLINFYGIKDMVLAKAAPVYITTRNITRTKGHEVVTREENKIYKPNSTKRNFFNDYSSLPYGHKRPKLC